MGSRYSKNWQKMQDAKKLASLKRQLRVLKSMPKNFRDMDPSLQPFQDLLRAITNAEQKQKMIDWMKGPILYMHPLTLVEKRILGPEQVVRSYCVLMPFDDADESTHFDSRLHVPTFTEIVCLMAEATVSYFEDKQISFIYLKNIPDKVFKSLNIMASFDNALFRFKTELTSNKGITPGL